MDEEVTLSELAAAIGASPRTTKNWPADGLPVLRRGGRGRGNTTTVSLRAACRWLLERPLMQANDLCFVRCVEFEARAAEILRRLDRERSPYVDRNN